MLVLTRKEGESIHIGDEIVITVLGVRQGRVRIGFDAPLRHRILRQEIELPVATAVESLNSTKRARRVTSRRAARQEIGSR